MTRSKGRRFRWSRPVAAIIALLALLVGCLAGFLRYDSLAYRDYAAIRDRGPSPFEIDDVHTLIRAKMFSWLPGEDFVEKEITVEEFEVLESLALRTHWTTEYPSYGKTVILLTERALEENPKPKQSYQWW